VNGDETILEDIEQYNNDDCRSTWLLHKWLLERRDECARAIGREVAWREPPPPPKIEETTPADELAARLLAGLPEPRTAGEIRDAEESVRARWLLGHLLQYHRREAKPGWWKVFDGYENADLLTEFNHEAIGDLTLCADVAPYMAGKRDRNPVYTYAFPDQLYNLGKSKPHCPHSRQVAGEVIEIDDENNRIAIKLAGKMVPQHLRALIPGTPIETKAQKAAINRLATAYEAGSISYCVQRRDLRASHPARRFSRRKSPAIQSQPWSARSTGVTSSSKDHREAGRARPAAMRSPRC
jgi:uncharacterized protein